MKASQFKEFIIEPTLDILGLYDENVVNFLLSIMAHESNRGEYIRQIGYHDKDTGAFGPYQMELVTHNYDIEYLKKRRTNLYILTINMKIVNMQPKQNLIGNMYYATAMARCHFLRFPESIPKNEGIEGYAKYWKKYWNTEAGKGKENDFIENYLKYVF